MRFWFTKSKPKVTANPPGPSPWYLRRPEARLKTQEGLWTWNFYDGPTLAGLSRLVSPKGETVLFVDFNCYIQPLSADRVLIWYESGRREEEKRKTPRIAFTIVSLPALVPFEDPQGAAVEMRAKKDRVRFEGGLPRFYEVATTLNEGTHPISPPPEFVELPELLILADFGPAEVASNHWDKMCKAIFAVEFKLHQVTVLPQEWFNSGRYDFGYQWITRVQRDTETGQIIGEGIRLGKFRLDQSGTQIQEWLHKDPFYHPEHGSE